LKDGAEREALQQHVEPETQAVDNGESGSSDDEASDSAISAILASRRQRKPEDVQTTDDDGHNDANDNDADDAVHETIQVSKSTAKERSAVSGIDSEHEKGVVDTDVTQRSVADKTPSSGLRDSLDMERPSSRHEVPASLHGSPAAHSPTAATAMAMAQNKQLRLSPSSSNAAQQVLMMAQAGTEGSSQESDESEDPGSTGTKQVSPQSGADAAMQMLSEEVDTQPSKEEQIEWSETAVGAGATQESLENVDSETVPAGWVRMRDSTLLSCLVIVIAAAVCVSDLFSPTRARRQTFLGLCTWKMRRTKSKSR
jgi:hypothetical protein